VYILRENRAFHIVKQKKRQNLQSEKEGSPPNARKSWLPTDGHREGRIFVSSMVGKKNGEDCFGCDAEEGSGKKVNQEGGGWILFALNEPPTKDHVGETKKGSGSHRGEESRGSLFRQPGAERG